MRTERCEISMKHITLTCQGAELVSREGQSYILSGNLHDDSINTRRPEEVRATHRQCRVTPTTRARPRPSSRSRRRPVPSDVRRRRPRAGRRAQVAHLHSKRSAFTCPQLPHNTVTPTTATATADGHEPHEPRPRKPSSFWGTSKQDLSSVS